MHISSIKLKGFKSFKKAEVELPPDFICLAGPNGSGKTNVLDAVRFALGEISLKSLRARRAKDLICHNSKYAEVALCFQDDRKYELKRAINEEGKASYIMNGKKTTRSAILELLKKYNLDKSGRNIIAQGEVQKIVEISGKERRTIVDAVAGIADFEAKKKEALRELEVVEGRMRDANLVLGERNSFLRELESEKEKAMQYSSASETVKRAKASLLRLELDAAEKRKETLENELEKAREASVQISSQMKGLDQELKKEEEKKAKVSAEIGAKEERERLLREMEKAKAEIASKKELLSDSREKAKELEESVSSLEKDIEHQKEVLEELSAQEKEIRKKMAPLENLKLETSESARVSGLRKSLEELEGERAKVREQLLVLKGEIEKTESIIKEKQSILEESGNTEILGLEELESEKEKLREGLGEIVGAQDRLFAKEKELNAENASLDRNLLLLREKCATLRAQVSASIRNPALQYINELRESGEVEGIHGTVAELIEFSSEYSKAVDAAGGGRLLYVVVDSADVATRAISKLKRAGRGRATFLPIREVSPQPPGSKGGMGRISDFISFRPEHKKAVDFVFGGTLLLKDSKEAKRIGITKERMVTLDGDLFEKSGIITGGKARGGAASAAQLSKLEGELESAKQRKSGIMGDLTEIREEMGSLRREKSDIEVSLRKKEVELDSLKEKISESEKKARRISTIKKEIADLENVASLSREKLASYEKRVSSLETEAREADGKLQEAIEAEASQRQSLEKEREDKVKMYSSLRAQADSKRREAEVRREGLKDKNTRLRRLGEEKEQLKFRAKQLDVQISRREDDLEKVSSKLGASDRAIKQLIGKMREFEEKLQELGGRRGELQSKLAAHEKTITVSEVELRNVETRLSDLSVEFEEYRETEPIEGNKEELRRKMRSAEATLSQLGQVNLAAPEMYEEKRKEIQEMEEKIGKLRIEKDAVIDMISGIEDRKKQAFFETFHGVDKEFRRLFTLINIGEGHLYLDKPSTPFESGLHIKVKRNDREHSLESLSGGEKSLVALMFVFALQFYKPSPFYVLDEVDAPLDKVNTKNLAKLLKELAPQSQFLVVSHNDTMMSMASAVLGVSRVEGISKIVGVKLEKEEEKSPVPEPDKSL